MEISKYLGLAFLLILGACDTFFVMHGVARDATTGLPVGGANVIFILDRGAGEPDQFLTTAPDGTVTLGMNEHASAWVTVTVEKEGYETWVMQFKGRSKTPVEFLLIPES